MYVKVTKSKKNETRAQLKISKSAFKKPFIIKTSSLLQRV